MSGGLFSQSPGDPWVHTPAIMASSDALFAFAELETLQ